MRIRRLGWAGLEIEAGDGTAVVVDLLQDLGMMTSFLGDAREPLLPPSRAGSVSVALVTHLHFDHTDAAAIASALAPDGVLLRPEPSSGDAEETIGTMAAERAITARGLTALALAPWQSERVAPFTFTAVPAVDGFGDPQVAWVIEADGCTVLHSGDSLFHGSWWLIAMRHGPIDVALLPINGAIVDLPHRRPPSPLEASMNPRQAATAAYLLGAREAVPIHYDTLHNDPIYVQTPDPAAAFTREAARLGVCARVLAVGEGVEVGDARPHGDDHPKGFFQRSSPQRAARSVSVK